MGLTAEQAIEKVGSFGRFQLRLYFLIAYVGLWTGSVLMVMTFSTAEPPWRCVTNSTDCNMTGEFRPGGDGYKIRCGLKRSSWEFVVDDGFDSIVTEWDLVCDKRMYASIANSMIFVIWMFASVGGSIISDKVGRKKVVFAASIFICLCGLCSALVQHYWLFVLCRTLAGAGIGAFSVVRFVFVLEYVGVRHRSAMGICIWWPWIICLCMLALLGYLIPSWRTLSIITSAPGFLFALAWWFIPESLRWLMVKNKHEEAKKTLVKIARMNGKDLKESDFKLDERTNSSKTERLGDIRDLFSSRVMICRTLVNWYAWAVCAFMYYGITLMSTTIGGNMYLNFFLSAVFEGIGMAIAIPMLNKFGRKKSVVSGLYVTALASLVAALLSYYDDGSTAMLVGKIITAMVIAKLFVTVAFDGIFIYSSELYPTVIRSTAMGTMTSAARIGSFCSPYVTYSQHIHPLLPFGIIGINAFISGALCMTLPETNKRAMPDHVGEIARPVKQEVEMIDTRDEKEDVQLLDNQTTQEPSN